MIDDADVAERPTTRALTGAVIAVSRSAVHNFSKENVPSIRLIAGLGIEGDAHLGTTVQHIVRMKEDPSLPNVRQVHLFQTESFEELRAMGYELAPGQLGENVTTLGLDLLHLPLGTRLHLGQSAVVELTGLRNPCRQIDAFRKGLMAAVLDKDEAGNLIRKCGVMGIVLESGELRAGDTIRTELPPEPHQPLPRV